MTDNTASPLLCKEEASGALGLVIKGYSEGKEEGESHWVTDSCCSRFTLPRLAGSVELGQSGEEMQGREEGVSVWGSPLRLPDGDTPAALLWEPHLVCLLCRFSRV